MIDMDALPKLPLGAITSHQTATQPDDPNRRIFGRNLLQIETLDHAGRHLLTLYNTRLKSRFVPFDQEAGKIAANARRRRQAETVWQTISRQKRRGGKFVLLGHMNDPEDSVDLAPVPTVDGEPSDQWSEKCN